MLSKKFTGTFVCALLLLAMGLGVFYVFRDSSPTAKKPGDPLFKNTNYVPGHSLETIKSNQWYSSLYKDLPSSPMFIMPMAAKIEQDAIVLSYPKVNKSPQTIFASFDPDIKIKLGSPITDTKLTKVGDWNIDVEFKSGQFPLSAQFARGVPYVLLKPNSPLTIETVADMKITDKKGFPIENYTKSHAFVISTKEKLYGVVLPDPVEISRTANSLTFNAPKVLIGVMNKPETLSYFEKAIDTNIVDTRAAYELSEGKFNTVYTVKTDGGKPLIALYPHQFENLSSQVQVIDEYETLRGPLKLIEANSFETSVPLITPDTEFELVAEAQEEIVPQIKKDIAEVIKTGPPDSKNYFFGTWLGKVSNLILLADTYGLVSERDQLVQFVSPKYEDVFSNYFYDTPQTSTIAKKAEFGNEELNDHHFHYGYYLRAASILIEYNPELIKKLTPQINQLAYNFATIDRQSTKFPYVRNFDIYENHSWADGYADTGDGNNQESSSEAINAWYSLYLWAKATGNAELEKQALALFNSEILGTKYYWFDKQNFYTQPYSHKLASIVWGGKLDFTTWFSGKPNMIYGIQLLPMSPASEYLATYSDFPKHEADWSSSGGRIADEWGDLFLMFKSFHKGQEAFEQKDLPQKLEGANTRSMLLYYLYKNRGK